MKGSKGDSRARSSKEAGTVGSEKDRKGLKKANGDGKDNQIQILQCYECAIMPGTVRLLKD